jgi:hypothetical protein
VFFDPVAFLSICIFLLISPIVGYFLLSVFRLRKKHLVLIVMLSALGHLLGAILYWYSSQFTAADSNSYFLSAASYHYWSFFGTGFVIRIVWFLRHFIFGNSLLGVFTFFAFVGFLGSVLYLVIFNVFLRKMLADGRSLCVGARTKIFSLLIACWPSSLFWASNLGKDSLCYFLIALFFLSLIYLNKNILSFPLLILSCVAAYFIRPYLFLVLSVAFFVWLVLSPNRKSSLFIKIFCLLLIALLFSALSAEIAKLGQFGHYNFLDIATRSNLQRHRFSAGSGTYITVPTTNPYFAVLFLPYTMFANLFMPLFFYAHNFTGLVASFENCALLIFSWKFLMRIKIWKRLNKSYSLLSYLLYFFFSGIGLLGLMNTNLGLASREKLMYLPAFLIVMFLVFSVRERARSVGVAGR